MRFNDRAMALAGIPDLPIDAFKKEGGKIKLHGGGGGQPANTTQTTTTIPEYAKPYVERMLGKAEAFTNTPYQAYRGERVAGFTPLQQQSFQSAAELGPTAQTGLGSQLAGMAGIRAGEASYAPSQFGILGARTRSFTQPGAAAAYMSPYQQAVTDIEKREAIRGSDIMRQQQQAQAVQQGAFGGARSAIVEAERQRNLGTQLGDIQARGGQSAFQQAQQQFNAEQQARLQAQLANQQAFMEAQRGTEQSRQFGAGYGMQGLQQQLAAAGALGQLGQSQFAQQQQAMQAQAAAGAQQQALEQQKLTQGYQDFLTQRGYPQQQLSFMSDILRGGPLSQTTYQMYQAPPSMPSQLAQLGLGAYGISQLGQSGLFRKEGGVVKSYAEGGIAMAGGGRSYDVPPEKLMGMMKKMSSEQLDTIGRSTNNAVTLGIVQAEMDRRQMMEEGKMLARAVPEGTVRDAMMGIDEVPIDPRMFSDTAVGEVEPAQESEEMARGGIVAFAKGDKVQTKPDYISEFAAMDPSKIFATPEERAATSEAALKRYKEYVGPDESIPAMQEFSKSLALTPEERASQRAGLALKTAAKFGRSGTTFSAELGEAFGVAAEEGEKAMKLDREIKRQQKLLDIDVKKAQRAEKRGEWDMLEKYGDKADAKAEKIAGLKMDQAKVLGEAQLKREQMANQLEAARISAGPGYAAANKPTDFRTAQSAFLGQAMADFRAKNPGKQPSELELATMNKQATIDAANAMKQYAGDIRGKDLERKIYSDAREQALKERDSVSNKEFRRIAKEKGISVADAQDLWIKDRTAEILAGMGGGGGGGGGATQQPAPAAGYREGQTGKDLNGKPIVFRNGQWVYQ